MCLRKECGQAYPDGANFCPYCGLPVRQDCPYQCGADVSIFASGQPTPECPSCGRIYRYNPKSYKLFTDFEDVDPNTGEPLVSPTVAWALVAANACHSNSIETKYGKAFKEKTKGWPIELINGQRPYTHPVYSSGRLLYVQDRYIASVSLANLGGPERLRQERANLPAALPGLAEISNAGSGLSAPGRALSDPSGGYWRVAAGKGTMYIALESQVHLYDVSTLQPVTAVIPGRFVQQLVNESGTWFGLEPDGEHFRIAKRDPDGTVSHFEARSLSRAQRLLEWDGATVVVCQDGETWRLERDGFHLAGAGQDGHVLQTCLSTGSYLVSLTAGPTGGGYRLSMLSSSGQTNHFPVPGATSVHPRLVSLRNKICLFPQEPGAILLQQFDLASLTFDERKALGLQRLLSVIGYSNQDCTALVVAGISGDDGQIWTVQPTSLAKELVCRFSNRLEAVNLLVADRWIVVGQNGEVYRALLGYEMS